MYVFVQDITLCLLYHVYVFWAGGRLLPNKSISNIVYSCMEDIVYSVNFPNSIKTLVRV